MSTTQRARAVLSGGLLLLLFLSLGAELSRASGTPRERDQMERGRYLVTVLGCDDCHSPKTFGPNGPRVDPERRLSGYPESSVVSGQPTLQGPWIAAATGDLTAWAGPWGVSFGTNLTPDENTGIGSWSEETFVQAIRTGRHMGVSRPILPPMPWEGYRNLTDGDIRAVYAYLRTIPAVSNRVPEPIEPTR